MHPIAGRCKHCKADLAEARGARPAAAAALPALAGSGSARPDARRPDPTPVPASPVRALALAAADAQPILPPRQTGRMQTPASPRGSLLRNWPVLVIILAGIAIAAAVIIMVWPTATTTKADNRLAPPPAPERMDTNPLPPHGSLTPPTAPSAPSAPSPRSAPGAPGGPDPWGNNGAAPDVDDIDPADPLAGPFAPRGGASGNSNAMTIVMFKHVCNRMASCGNPMLSSACQMFDQLAGPVQQPTCAAAQRCVDSLDQLDCNVTSMSSMNDAQKLFNGIQDCADAMARC